MHNDRGFVLTFACLVNFDSFIAAENAVQYDERHTKIISALIDSRNSSLVKREHVEVARGDRVELWARLRLLCVNRCEDVSFAQHLAIVAGSSTEFGGSPSVFQLQMRIHANALSSWHDQIA